MLTEEIYGVHCPVLTVVTLTNMEPRSKKIPTKALA
jgi:hypothetical protein